MEYKKIGTNVTVNYIRFRMITEIVFQYDGIRPHYAVQVRELMSVFLHNVLVGEER